MKKKNKIKLTDYRIKNIQSIYMKYKLTPNINHRFLN